MATGNKQPISITHPEIAAQAHGWDPSTVNAGSNKNREWQCKLGHIWSARVAQRTGRNTGCRYCAGQAAWPGFNDCATTHPELAAQAHGWDPTTVMAGTNKKLEWKCDLGHIWVATGGNRSFSGTGCPYCADKSVWKGYNDLTTTHLAIAGEAHGWDPTEVRSGSSKNRDWICEFGHIWSTSPRHRTRNLSGCPFCAGQRVISGKNDLKTTHPDIAGQAHGWDPATVHAGNKAHRTWRCDLNHLWSARVDHRTRSGSNCPTCSGHIVQAGFNDLATTHPELAAEAHG